MKGIYIDITALPLNKNGEYMWVQEHPNGEHSVRLDRLDFGEVVLEGMAQAHQAEMRRREAELYQDAKGVQGR